MPYASLRLDAGQLVFCPSDPSLGVGLITEREGYLVKVRFMRLSTERNYTLRSAEPPLVRYEIGQGERAEHNGKSVRIRCRIEGPGGADALLWHYELEGGATVAESELVPFVRDIGAKERLASLQLSHPETLRARLIGLSLAHFGARAGLSAVVGARAQWLPHQLDVAARALGRDPIRFLLADEVGLGKTVEAALILAGLRQEGRAKRVLILTPQSLSLQWLGEIFRKTHELMVLLDEARLADAQRDFPNLSAFEAHQRMVAPIELIARDPVLCAQAEKADWDVVIVDEAHHLRWQREHGGNPAYRLVEALAKKTRHLMLLTATPMALDPTEYQVLLRLLDPERFDDPAQFARLSERALALRDVARALQLAVDGQASIDAKTLTAAYELLGDDPEDTNAMAVLAELAPKAAERPGALVPVLSALEQRHGLSEYVTRNRRGPVGGMPKRKAQIFALTPSPEQEALIEVGETVMLELAAAIDDVGERQRMVGELLRALWATPAALLDIVTPYSRELARELLPLVRKVTQSPVDHAGLPVGDTRLRWLVEQIRALESGEKLLVFVESTLSVKALKEALEPLLGGQGVAVFYRELPARDQDRQVAYFRAPDGPQVMLSTEAGGEGRNFQFCHRVVLYDMPWRPATIEQRIGRIDRVGQTKDVVVLVPHLKQGFEAAIVKIMQQAIGVLDRTVGGIDHALEDVSGRLADLILHGEGADAWKALFREVEKLIGDARARIEADVDPILDHASFSPARAQALLNGIPHDLEEKLAHFVSRYAEHTRLEMHAKGQARVAVEGGPSAAGSLDDAGYLATFSRTDAIDHEDIEFLSFGHPLVEGALAWAQEAHDCSAALALYRGWSHDGAAFVWTFEPSLPDDVSAARTYLPSEPVSFALDEQGKPVPALDNLLAAEGRALDRMDPTPLRHNLERWRMLVERNFEKAEAHAQKIMASRADCALKALDEAMAQKLRHLRRRGVRHLAQLEKDHPKREEIVAEQQRALNAHEQEHRSLREALLQFRARLVCAVAIRLARTKEVSA